MSAAPTRSLPKARVRDVSRTCNGQTGGSEVLAEQRLLGAVRADAGAEPARLEGHQLHRGR